MSQTDAAKRRSLRNTTAWKISVLLAFAVAVAGGFLVSNSVGATKIAIPDILKAIFVDREGTLRQILWNIRVPRTIVAMLTGLNLALSGVILQGVMRNPLADPHIIGISSGAGLAGVSILILFPHLTYLVPPVAFAGAMAAAVLIYILAWKGGIQPVRMILAGVAVSSFLGAGISALMVFYSDRVQGALMFMTGGLAAKSWPHVWTLLPYTLLGGIASLVISEKLNILALGDDVARGVGLRVEAARLLFTAIAALLAASAVCVAGLLGFVGLVVPHTARLLIGSNHKYLIPASALLGAAVVTFSDTLARTLFSPREIPVGVVMAVLGAPFFLYLLRREK